MTICPACGEENIDGAEACEHCGQDLTYLSRPRAHSLVEKALHKEMIRSLRPHPPVIVPETRKVKDVLVSLVLHKDGCAVVVNADGAPVGIFSERDLILKVAGKGDDLLDHPVSEFMTPDPVTIDAEVPIAYALHQMDLKGYRHLPVVKDGKPVSMVSVRDIVTLIGSRFLTEGVSAALPK